VRYERTTTESARKYAAAVRVASNLSSSSYWMVELRGLEGSERKTENWTATRSRPMVEDDRDLKHPVYEKKGPPDVLSLCSSAVPVIDCEERCPGSPI